MREKKVFNLNYKTNQKMSSSPVQGKKNPSTEIQLQKRALPVRWPRVAIKSENSKSEIDFQK